MKKGIILLLCIILLMNTALSVCANDHMDFRHTEHQGEIQHTLENGQHNGDGDHKHSYEHVHDTATCNTSGMITKTCSCGEYITEESPAKGHHLGSGVDLGNGNHECSCSRCGEKITEPHSYGTWTSNHTRECTVCHSAETGTHSLKEEITKQPTCKEDGAKKKYCVVCTYSETVLLTKLTIHTYDSACDAECNVCKRQRDIEHTFTTTWSKDHDGHWYECTKCGEKADYSRHASDGDATEEKAQVCLACNYVMAAKKEHVHSYEKAWTNDKVGHWHACTGKNCDVEKDYASHDYDDECDSDCNTCNYKRENSHVYDTDGWLISNFEHWNICSICGEESKHEKHIAGEEASEESAQFCSVCHFELAPKMEHTHSFGTEYITQEDSHWQECGCGELSVPEPHVWDSGKESSNNTIIYTCILCGMERSEEASAAFSWLIIILIILALICITGIVVLVMILRRGNFEDESDDAEEVEEDNMETDASEEDKEEKMIDDYYASLDE